MYCNASILNCALPGGLLVVDMARTEAQEKKLRGLYSRWSSLVNMTPSELKRYIDSEDGKNSGLSRSEASSAGVSRGRDSAKAIIRMKEKASGVNQAIEKWSTTEWEWAGRQVSFISRMKGNQGPLYTTVDGKKVRTRKLMSLLIWGHNPKKVSKMKVKVEKNIAGLAGESVQEYTESFYRALKESLNYDSEKHYCFVVALYSKHAIYAMHPTIGSDSSKLYRIDYTYSADKGFGFEFPTEVEKVVSYVPVA